MVHHLRILQAQTLKLKRLHAWMHKPIWQMGCGAWLQHQQTGATGEVRESGEALLFWPTALDQPNNNKSDIQVSHKQTMGLDNRQTTVTTGLWAVNIASATALIMFNLLTVKSRLAAPATVSALHSLTTAACVALLSSLGAWGESEAPKLPRKHLMAFVLISEWTETAEAVQSLTHWP